MQYDELSQERRDALEVLVDRKEEIDFMKGGNIFRIVTLDEELRNAAKVFDSGGELIFKFEGIRSLVNEAYDRKYLHAGSTGHS